MKVTNSNQIWQNNSSVTINCIKKISQTRTFRIQLNGNNDDDRRATTLIILLPIRTKKSIVKLKTVEYKLKTALQVPIIKFMEPQVTN